MKAIIEIIKSESEASFILNNNGVKRILSTITKKDEIYTFAFDGRHYEEGDIYSAIRSLKSIVNHYAMCLGIDINFIDSASCKNWRELKAKHSDVVLLMGIDDFYLQLGEDAHIVSEVCDVVLRELNGTDATIFASYQLDSYLPKLIRAGKRVAICNPI